MAERQQTTEQWQYTATKQQQNDPVFDSALSAPYELRVYRAASLIQRQRASEAIALNFIIVFNTRKYFIIYIFKRWLGI